MNLNLYTFETANWLLWYTQLMREPCGCNLSQMASSWAVSSRLSKSTCDRRCGVGGSTSSAPISCNSRLEGPRNRNVKRSCNRANRKGSIQFLISISNILKVRSFSKHKDQRAPGLQPWIAVNFTVILQALVRRSSFRGSSRTVGLPGWQIRGGSLAALPAGQSLYRDVMHGCLKAFF